MDRILQHDNKKQKPQTSYKVSLPHKIGEQNSNFLFSPSKTTTQRFVMTSPKAIEGRKTVSSFYQSPLKN